MPLGNLCHFTWSQNREKIKLGAQIDITNTLSMSMVKIFSQLLLYHIMDIDTFHFQLAS